VHAVPASADSVYCTIFDSGYLARALALHASLVEASPRARLAFFCVDELASRVLESLQLDRAIVVAHESFATPELRRLESLRSRGEYCWTCKPFALLHLARELPQAQWFIYVDTDMMFFGDPDAALPVGAHYLLTPHRFHSAFEKYERAGRYNAGYLAMCNSSEGRRAVEWWRERCVESCIARVTDIGYADQKYLERLPELFPFGEESAHPGLNSAPWNIERYTLAKSEGRVYLDGQPLLLYHFQALRLLNRRLVDLYAGDRRISDDARRLIYRPYLERVAIAYRTLTDAFPSEAPQVESALRSVRDWLRLAYEMARGYHNVERFATY
jgi:hypothetical protein